ncbi:uncharacterized protein LOC111380266 [Olea europaea var. sylvestris]|uniref:uncharacterized protein LOC111380266 n=1 Tax=Olea europaea var. sylvestris TaxID=158386 RepID=UPI000C1D0785|nr:uncharacterized protein LOC111380266 [Olea europaea var. sylvestris]
MWSSERAIPRKTPGVYEVDAYSAILAKIDSLYHKVESISQVKKNNCEECGAEHKTSECPILMQGIEQADYAQWGQRQQQNQYGETFNPSWKKHPNFSWSDQNQNKPQGQFQQQEKRDVPPAENEIAVKESTPREDLEKSKDKAKSTVNPYGPLIPFPQRLKKQKMEQQYKKFLEVFKNLHINIPLADALFQMPSHAKFLKDIISNKCKLEDHETVMLTEECSARIQNKLPPKLKDSGSFTLADRSLTHPRGIIEDVLIKVKKFIFPADFLILDMEEDKDIPLILGRPFLATGRALIDVQRGQLILRLGEEQVSFNVFKAMKMPAESDSCYQVDIINKAVQETFLLHGPSDTYETCIAQSQSVQSNSFEVETCARFLETNPPYARTKHFEKLGTGNKKPLPSIQQPPVLELKQLPPHLRYAYLGESDTLLVIISNTVSEMEEEKLLKILRENKTAIGWTIADIKGISPSLSTRKDHFPFPFIDQMLERLAGYSHYCFLDGYSGYNQIPEGIVLGHRISTKEIEVDKAKIQVIEKLPSPTLVKGVRSFLGHTGFYRRFIKDFRKSLNLCALLMKDVTFEFNEDCLTAFNTLKEKLTTALVIVAPDWELPFELMSYLVGSKVIVYTDHATLKYLLTKKDAKPRLIRWVLLLQEFDIEIRDKKGTENVVADHLSRLEPGETEDLVDINEIFPDEQMLRVDEAPWYADIVNYLASSIPPPDCSSHQRNFFFAELKYYFSEDPILYRRGAD